MLESIVIRYLAAFGFKFNVASDATEIIIRLIWSKMFILLSHPVNAINRIVVTREFHPILMVYPYTYLFHSIYLLL